MPIDPSDLGRSYDAVIRVNSQSGKGGIAYLLESSYGIELPRRFQIELARHVQALTDTTGAEVNAHEVWEVFERNYLPKSGVERVQLTAYEVVESGSGSAPHSRVNVLVDGVEQVSTHAGVGPVESLTSALSRHGFDIKILTLHQTSIGYGNDSLALTLLEVRVPQGVRWVAGSASSVLSATLEAVIRAANTIALQESALHLAAIG
ncbi:alpha-isopropylmalate synthase regulatory domain-containing protein [Leucobacter coleopterorum]|uniref:alpha-isopropylmalate synthase regulatory domain-containing protein n=1 Tax=Leucobacter coleopterorum TaxID=2714933 RepID=UPI003CC70A6C